MNVFTKVSLLFLLVLVPLTSRAQKTVFIPSEFSTDPALKAWSWDRSFQSANFVLFWGPVVGTTPATYSDPNLRFDPQSICNLLEAIYTKYIKEIGFCSEAPTKNLGKYKIIIVMNETWGAGGPSGWAFGGQYDGTIGAMWVHPNSTRDGGVLSHELTHSLQAMISIQENTSGGGFNSDAAGFFWECHANFMRTQMYPKYASDDLPRWMATSMFHWSSTRHHYDSFKLLWHMQDVDGIGMINRLWKESVAQEHPLITYRRLKGWNQSQLNDFIYDYAKCEVTCDYRANGVGAIMRTERERLKVEEPHYMWRLYTILDQVSGAAGHYVVPDAFAPQEYGYNIIPLYPTCSSKIVQVKFKGHPEVNGSAGWRYGMVAVKLDGATVRYGPMASANEGELTFQMTADETSLYLVVVGAPSAHISYPWEPGWPKIDRYPYELTLENALPEGYQPDYRSAYKTNGHAHPNGGGWIANSASVATTVFVGPRAVVLGNSRLSGAVRVDGRAWIQDAAVTDNVVISGNASVFQGNYSGNAQILENAVLSSCTVSGSAMIKGDALEWGTTFGNSVIVGGDAEVGDSSSGVYLQCPHPNNHRLPNDGKGASDPSNQDVNTAYSKFSDAQMALTAPVGCPGTPPPPPPPPPPPTAGRLNRTGWTLKFADSQETRAENGAAINVLDGLRGTFWHTSWSAVSNPGYPHEIQIDMHASHAVSGFAYLPRQDGISNGRIAGYQIYISADGVTWGSPARTGVWANSATEKVVHFTAKTGRYVRLVATSEVNGRIWASAAEINIIGTN